MCGSETSQRHQEMENSIGSSSGDSFSSSLSYYEYMMAYYIEELFENPARDAPITVGDISSWDTQRRPLRTPHEGLNASLLQQFLQIWFQASINQMNYEEELNRIGSQLFPSSTSNSCFRDSKYHNSLDSIASINEKRGSYRLSIKEKFFNLFRTNSSLPLGNGNGKIIKEITHKSLSLLQIFRYLFRIFYDFYFLIQQNQRYQQQQHQPLPLPVMELHHRRYSRALKMFHELKLQLNQSTQTNLQRILSLVENFQEISLRAPSHATMISQAESPQDRHLDEDFDNLIQEFEDEDYFDFQQPTVSDPFEIPFDEDETISRNSKRHHSSVSSSLSESTNSDARYYLPSSPSCSSTATRGDPVAMDLNNTLTLIQQQHPHRLEELSRQERAQLFHVLYPRLFNLIQSQHLPFFQTHCYPILKVILAYRAPHPPQHHHQQHQQQHSKEAKFYVHYFMKPDLVNEIDRLLHPILPNMAPEEEEDTYLCQVRDPSFFLWLKKQHPHWEDEGHHLILNTFQRFYHPNWHTLVNPSDVMNPCLDYVPYVARNLLYHLFQARQFDLVRSLVHNVEWLSSVISWVGIPVLIEQISSLVHDAFVDTELSNTLLPLLLDSSCLTVDDSMTSYTSVTVLTILSSFLKSLAQAPPQFNPERNPGILFRALAMFLQIRLMSHALYTFSSDLSLPQ